MPARHCIECATYDYRALGGMEWLITLGIGREFTPKQTDKCKSDADAQALGEEYKVECQGVCYVSFIFLLQ